MSITKIDSLNFELEYDAGYYNNTIEIEFNKDGLDIKYSTIPWDDIRAAHKLIFGSDIEDKT